MSTNPYPEAHTSDEAVERLGLKDTPPEERFDRITRLAKDLFDVDYAVMNVVDSEAVFTKSQGANSAFAFTPPEDSFCQIAVAQPSILEVDDAAKDPRFADRAIVTEHGVRFYAGFPIRTEAGEAVGTLCLLDTSPRTLNDADREALTQLGAWAQAEMRASDPDVAGTSAAGASGASSAPVEPQAGDILEPVLAVDHVDGEVQLAALAIPFHRLSGDRSAWRQLDHTVLVALTDIMGKGEVASGFAQTLVDFLLDHADLAPIDALRAAEDTARAEPAYRDTFATLFYAAIHTDTGRVEFVDAGHGLTLVLRADGSYERLSSQNLPLGLRPREIDWEPGQTTVGSGDIIVSVSDGALDAYDSTLDSLRLIGEDVRRAHSADGFFDALSVRVSEHAVDDDVTAVVVSVL